MAGARRMIPVPRPVSRYPVASSEPLPRRPVCSEYCLYRFMSVLYGISYFVSILNVLATTAVNSRLRNTVYIRGSVYGFSISFHAACAQ